MKPVEIMLNFLRRKTVKRSDGRGNDEPPIMMMTSSEENHIPRRSEKSNSVVFESEFTNGGHRFHSIHSSCSSLDEVRFAPIQASPRGVYVKNQRKMSVASSGLDDSYSESPNGIVRPSNEQPPKQLYHSPKASQRLSNSHRSSGHSRSLTAIADPASSLRSAERKGVFDYLRSSVVEVTPRLYRKNPQQQQKPLPFHAPSTTDAGLLSDSPGAAEVSFSGSQGSQWSSFGGYAGGVDTDASPVPPPRKKRSSRAGRDFDGDRSSQTSSSTEATSDARSSMETSARCTESENSSNIESPEFQCNLPNDFSNLGLDILNISSVVLSPANEKSNFDLLHEIDKKKKRGDAAMASPMSPDNSVIIKSGDVLRIEPSACRILDSDIFLFNNECSTSSVCDSSFESVFQNETADLSRRPKLQSEVIVKSIFSKNQNQDFSDQFNLKYGEHEDEALCGKDGPQAFDFSKQDASSAVPQSRATEALRNFRHAPENCFVHENSAAGGPSVPFNSDRNPESVRRHEDLLTNSVRALQPDVLIGTQQNPSISYASSSFADDSHQSSDPVHNRCVVTSLIIRKMRCKLLSSS